MSKITYLQQSRSPDMPSIHHIREFPEDSPMIENIKIMIKENNGTEKENGKRYVVSNLVIATAISDKGLTKTFAEWVKSATGTAKSEHQLFIDSKYYGTEHGVIGKIAVYFYHKEVDANTTSYRVTIHLRNRKEVGEEDKVYEVELDLE